ncbi:histidine phosphatase family protein [Litoreibacter janthinus]|uniref:Broad specificity phosphatase PhoE n=1 Tax=Litoreibacter janthinus TaxID=670154 RepID=A0A1I6HGU9_9RHOB|nr:histidine phosphatase family protein [Litoreibacter janthinus]SFR53598.1 Broad specificity phosphatase PhoE [Litoreibacter janthinus]
MRRAYYLSHPQVHIEPEVEIDQWGLSDVGRARVATLIARDLPDLSAVYSSLEVKALETARPLADASCCPLQPRADMGENDRSATGFLPPSEFETTADRFFAEPDRNVRGWETARAAQKRITASVQTALLETSGDVLFVGHGGVGTLLYCALRGVEIDRRYDQGPGGGGQVFDWIVGHPPETGWKPMETL